MVIPRNPLTFQLFWWTIRTFWGSLVLCQVKWKPGPSCPGRSQHWSWSPMNGQDEPRESRFGSSLWWSAPKTTPEKPWKPWREKRQGYWHGKQLLAKVGTSMGSFKVLPSVIYSIHSPIPCLRFGRSYRVCDVVCDTQRYNWIILGRCQFAIQYTTATGRVSHGPLSATSGLWIFAGNLFLRIIGVTWWWLGKWAVKIIKDSTQLQWIHIYDNRWFVCMYVFNHDRRWDSVASGSQVGSAISDWNYLVAMVFAEQRNGLRPAFANPKEICPAFTTTKLKMTNKPNIDVFFLVAVLHIMYKLYKSLINE